MSRRFDRDLRPITLRGIDPRLHSCPCCRQNETSFAKSNSERVPFIWPNPVIVPMVEVSIFTMPQTFRTAVTLVLCLNLILGLSDCGSIVPIEESRLGQPSHSGHNPKLEK